MSLSKEEREKLAIAQPQTVSLILISLNSQYLFLYIFSQYFQIAAASRIQGITPTAVLQILHYVKRYKKDAIA